MTDKDEELIALLRLNARAPIAALARQLGVSRTTVQDRLARLERNGIIEGYDVRLKSGRFNNGIRAYVTIEVEPSQTQTVLRGLKDMATVETLHTVSGKYDLIALVHTSSADSMDQMLDEIGALNGVKRTESAIILSTRLDRK